MPRNYSIKDTIQQAKDEIHRKKIKKLQDNAEPKRTAALPDKDYQDKESTLIRFNDPKPEQEEENNTTDKKWYQFWK